MPYNRDHAKFAIQFNYPGSENLQVKSISGKEKMSGLFKFEMELISQTGDLDFKTVVGRKVTAKLIVDDDGELGDGGFRYFNGIITEFSYLGWESTDVYRYRAIMRPWFWMLTRTNDCRIFQNKTVPDIIKEVFKLNNMVDYKQNLKGTYREWEYCVQYNESDFNFVSRLMEQEGIYYFFRHEDGKHTLTMVDDLNSHEEFPGFGTIVYNPGFGQGAMMQNSLRYFAGTQNIQPSAYAIQDYDFKNPNADLLAKYNNRPDNGYEYPLEQPEIFDYPGEYVVRDQGNSYAEIRLQELQCQWERMHASGNCRGLAPGFTFTLEESPRQELNKEYLTVSVKHKMQNHDYVAGQASYGREGEVLTYQCEIEVVDAHKVRFRAPRTTPKPIVRGPQTAMVVGPSGDEIYTDEYGRVKVHFHWDRYGAKDENASCWMRVATMWAGTKWGGIHIPRIGQEVVVNFLEGDPDRPLITGSVYNANTMPPYELVANKTQSGIKSRSTTKGSADNFNEIRMEDKIGEEQLYIHAEKNQDNVVENDETTQVGHDRTENVGNNETISIGNDRAEDVGRDETITINQDRTETVGRNESISIGADRTENVGRNETITIGEERTESVGKSESVSIGENQTIAIGKNQSENVGGSISLNVGKNRESQVGQNDTLNVAKNLVLEVGDSITLKCGSATLVMKKNGNITLNGKDLTLTGSGKATVKASKDVVIKGSKVLAN